MHSIVAGDTHEIVFSHGLFEEAYGEEASLFPDALKTEFKIIESNVAAALLSPFVGLCDRLGITNYYTVASFDFDLPYLRIKFCFSCFDDCFLFRQHWASAFVTAEHIKKNHVWTHVAHDQDIYASEQPFMNLLRENGYDAAAVCLGQSSVNLYLDKMREEAVERDIAVTGYCFGITNGGDIQVVFQVPTVEDAMSMAFAFD
jgi:hypothetical protein